MMDDETRALFERSLAEALKSHDGAELDKALEDLGWHEAFGEDPHFAVSALFELAGATNTIPPLDHVAASRLCPGTEPVPAVVLPRIGAPGAPGGTGAPGAPGGTGAPGHNNGGTITVEGLGSARLARSRRAVVAVGSGDDITILAIGTEVLSFRQIAGIDPALGLVEVSATLRFPASAWDATESGEKGAARWRESIAIGQLALAHELIGVSRTMLRLACEHALERVQFGHPISAFQAVRHRLADSFVAIESAEASVGAAWELGSPLAAATAKAIAGRGAAIVSANAQQVLAGMGFTAEHPFHRYARRAIVADQLLGSSHALTASQGEALLAEGSLPAQLPL